MGRRLSAVLLAALLAFATASCGGDSDDESSAGEDGTTQTDDTGASDDTGDTDTDDAADDRADRRAERREERREARKERREERKEKSDRDDDSALPDDLPSEDSADPDDLPIDADAILQACDDVDPADTWPAVDDIYFDTSGGKSNVVATAEVELKGDTIKVACDVMGSANSPHVMAYNPV